MQLFLIFLKNKVAYVSYPNLKNYFVSRVWCKFHRIPVNHQEKICGEWVQTRGYQACVFCMPIPLRVCLARAAQEVRGTSDLCGPEWNVEPRTTNFS